MTAILSSGAQQYVSRANPAAVNQETMKTLEVCLEFIGIPEPLILKPAKLQFSVAIDTDMTKRHRDMQIAFVYWTLMNQANCYTSNFLSLPLLWP